MTSISGCIQRIGAPAYLDEPASYARPASTRDGSPILNQDVVGADSREPRKAWPLGGSKSAFQLDPLSSSRESPGDGRPSPQDQVRPARNHPAFAGALVVGMCFRSEKDCCRSRFIKHLH